MNTPLLGVSDIIGGGTDPSDGRRIDHTPKAVAAWAIAAGVFLILFHEVGGFRVVIGAGKA